MTEPSAGLEQEETEHDVDLIHECVVKMAKEISDFMDITPDKQRMDSLMVAANIRNLSLLELFYTCVANLCKIMDERGTKIPDEQYHYIKKDDYNKCIPIMVVNAQHIKGVPGRKTDVKDAEWIADLVRHGLVKASYIPNRDIIWFQITPMVSDLLIGLCAIMMVISVALYIIQNTRTLKGETV